jgi:hypothetical protein
MVAEAEDRSGMQRKGSIHSLGPLTSNSSEDVTVDTSAYVYMFVFACVKVNCKM